MANFFSLQNGNLTNDSTWGYSIPSAEVMGLTSATWLPTTETYGPVFNFGTNSGGAVISAIAVHLSSRVANPTSEVLTLKLSAGATIITETYAISSFTSYDGSNNQLTPHPQNWQILRLTNPFTFSTNSNGRISLNTSSPNTLAVMCSATNNNHEKAVIRTIVGIPTPSSSDNYHIGGSLLSSTMTELSVIASNLGASATVNNLFIHNKGYFNFPTNTSITLFVTGPSGLQITSDGTLNIGTSSNVIPLSTTHILSLSNTKLDVHNGGNLNVYGYPKTIATNLISDVVSGAKTFTTTDVVSTSWLLGDTVTFKPNLTYRTGFDTLTLSSFTGPNTFTTTTSSVYTHTGSATYAQIPAVYNLSRNVTIQGNNSTNRVSFRSIDAAKVNICDTYLKHIGVTEAGKRGLMLHSNLSGYNYLSGNVIDIFGAVAIGGLWLTYGFKKYSHNLTFNNNIIYKGNTSESLVIDSLSTINLKINNNYFLSGGNYESMFKLGNLSGTCSMSNNTTVGSLCYGTYLYNNSLTGTYGALNYNSASLGMLVSGTNTGTIVGGSINSAKEGVCIDASTGNLSGVVFKDILTNNNSSVGFKVSANSLNYLSSFSLNVNGLTASDNSNAGFEGYNISGNLSSIVANNNYAYGMKTSIGSNNTTFDGVSVYNTYPTGVALTKTGTIVNSSDSPFGVGTDSSLYFNGSSNSWISIPAGTNLNFGTGDFTIETWVKTTTFSLDTDGRCIFSFGNGAANELLLVFRTGTLNTSTSISASSKISVYSNVYLINGTIDVANGNWNHVCLQRSGTSLQLYVNGIQCGTTTSTANYNAGLTIPLSIGKFTSSTGRYEGLISNFRIVKGRAVYSNNFNTQTPISPPTPLTIVPNTVFLYNAPYGSEYKDTTSSMCGIGILSGYNYGNTVIKNAVLSSNNIANYNDYGLFLDSTRFSRFSLENSTLSTTTPLQINTTRNILEGSYLFNNSYLGSTPLGTGIVSKYQPETLRSTGFAFTNLNKISANNITYLTNGERSLDKSIANNNSQFPSERLTPYSATNKIRSGSKFVALNSGDTTTIRVFVRKSISTGGETAYNGNPPRLILKRNPYMGIPDDVVLDQLTTMNDVTGLFILLTNVTSAVTNNGVLEFYVDCDGTQGWINIDNWDAL